MTTSFNFVYYLTISILMLIFVVINDAIPRVFNRLGHMTIRTAPGAVAGRSCVP